MRSLFSLACFFFSLTILAQNTYTEVSLPELMKKKQQNPDIIIVDVRTNGEYYDSATNYKQGNIGRIKGTLHIELRDLLQKPETLQELEAYKNKDVYLICSHSYRSRSACNMLLKNGFTHVNNVRGGMTEWFRRYDELSPFRNDYYETSDKYTNLAPSQLYKKLDAGDKVMMIGIASKPAFWYDSMSLQLYRYFPAFKNAVYFSTSDSMRVLEKIRKENPTEVVLFNMVNSGAAELADWLTQQGIAHASYLVGSENLFNEYVQNNNLSASAGKFMTEKSAVNFITPLVYCNNVNQGKQMLLVDLRPDSLFNKINDGMKKDYTHLKDAVNFPDSKGLVQFIQQFPDKKKEYVLISQNGVEGLMLADELTKKGYRIHWLIGGMQRFDWYITNVETFSCPELMITE